MGVRIKNIATYHPEAVLNNDVLIDMFDHRGVDLRNLLESAGRKRRHIANPSETSFTMALKASKKALEEANLTAKDIDYIIYASDSPEYLVPTNSMLIHRELECKSQCGITDMNSNCVGLVNALYLIHNTMTCDPSVKKALLVGSQQLFHFGEAPAIKGLLGDSACAMIVEFNPGDSSYIEDSIVHTESTYATDIYFPSNGLSGLREETAKIDWQSQRNPGRAFYHAHIDIETLLNRNHVKKSDVKKYFISQMTIKELNLISEELNEPIDKFTYVGDEYGYTGVTSPFLAMKQAIDNQELERGDYIIIWSIGAGLSERGILLRY